MRTVSRNRSRSSSFAVTTIGALGALVALGVFGAAPVSASSHREAQGVIEDPMIDNTDLYAWVNDGAHDRLYLAAGYNGLHEPGQGNQQTRLGCNVLYEFHVSRGTGLLDDEITYQIKLNCGKPVRVDTTDLTLPPGGGKELLVQLSGQQFKYTVTKVWKNADGSKSSKVIGASCTMAPPNIGPVTDRVVYGLGGFTGYTGGNPSQFEDGLYDQAFVESFICDMGAEGRAFVGVMDDAFYLDEKGIFDILNLANLPGGRSSEAEDVFAGFNLNVIALDLPTTKVLGKSSIPHNGTCGDDTLLSVWTSASRRKERVFRPDGSTVETGPWVQVGRQGLPLVNAGLIGTQDQNKYLRTKPVSDVANFAPYFLNPILVRDLEFLGVYDALGVPQAAVDSLKSGRVDILQTINLDDIPAPGCHSVPIAAGKTGDVLRLDVATNSQFPNGRRIGGNADPYKEQVDVSDVLISLIVAGDPGAGIGDSVNRNDRPYLTTFPFFALPHQGLNEGHGAPAP